MPHDLTHRTRSWLRTTVPVVWAAIIDSSGALAAPDWITAPFGGAAETVSVAAVLALIYPALRTLEPHMPSVLTRVLLGSGVSPVYAPTRPGR